MTVKCKPKAGGMVVYHSINSGTLFGTIVMVGRERISFRYIGRGISKDDSLDRVNWRWRENGKWVLNDRLEWMNGMEDVAVEK